MSMTLEEMKLAVCEKLPKLIKLIDAIQFWMPTPSEQGIYKVVQWPTEGLQVCHEAEKLLDKHNTIVRDGGIYHNEASLYVCLLLGVGGWPALGFDAPALFDLACISYEQRLEALCRVWFPERF